MFKINYKLLAILIIAPIVLGGGVHLLHEFQVKRSAGFLLERAERAEKTGDLDEAERSLSRYLGFKPADAGALSRYAQVLDAHLRKDMPDGRAGGVLARRTLAAYQKALQLDSRQSAVRRKLAAFAVDLGAFPEAVPHVEALLEDAPGDGELEGWLGRCRESAGRHDEAEESLRESIAHAPGLTAPAIQLAEIYRSRPDRPRPPEEADAVVDAMVSKNNDSAKAFLARAWYRGRHRLDGVGEDLEKAKQLAADDSQVALAFAALGGRETRDEARPLLERAMAREPKAWTIRHALAELELRAGRPVEAEAVVRRGLEACGERTALAADLAQCLISQGKKAEARAQLAALREKEVPARLMDDLEAGLSVLEERWPEAVRQLLAMRSVQHDPAEVQRMEMLLARCYANLGNPEARLAAVRRALAVDPGSLPARQELARALAAAGKIDEALLAYRELAHVTPAAAVEVARLTFLHSLLDPTAKESTVELDHALTEAERAVPGSPDVALIRAQAMTVRGEFVAARALIESRVAAHSDRADLWVALTELTAATRGASEALAVLDKAAHRLGDRIELRIARADRLASSRSGPSGLDAADVKAITALGDNVDRFDEAARAQLLDGLAEIQLRSGATDEAMRLWRRLAILRPHDLKSYDRLFTLALRKGDLAAARRAVDDLRNAEGDDGMHWRLDDAALLIARARRGDMSELAKARTEVTEAAGLQPLSPGPPFLEAEIASLEGDPARAAAALRKVFELSERTSGRPRQAEVDRLLGVLERGTAAAGDADRLMAVAALVARAPDQAVEAAARAVPDGASAADCLWLSRFVAAAGRPDLAEPALRRAIAADPRAPEAYLHLARDLVRSGRRDQAVAVIDQARAALPADRLSTFLAQGYDLVGQAKQASEQYKSALAAGMHDPTTLKNASAFFLRAGQSDAAEPLLRELLEIAPAAERAATRRGLAAVLASERDGRRADEAITLIDVNLASKPIGEADSASDMLAKVNLLASRPGRRREAIQVLEDLQRRRPDPESEFLRARLLDLDGDWPAAERTLHALIDSGASTPNRLAYLGMRLIQRERTDEAARWVEALETVEPDTPRSVAARASLLHAQGRGDEAVARLEKFAHDRPDDAVKVAGLLESLGDVSAAEAIYRADASRPGNHSAALQLALFLGRQGRSRDALDICERTVGAVAPKTTTGIVVLVLAAATPDETILSRAEALIDEARKKDTQTSTISEHLALLRGYQGRYDESEKIFRDLLEKNSRDVSALNNLAWLLSLKRNQAAEALELIDRALDAVGPAPNLLDTRAVVNLSLGRAEAAVRDVEEALVSGPTVPLYFHLAQAHLLANRPAEAARALNKAKSFGLKPESLDVLERPAYGPLLARLGKG